MSDHNQAFDKVDLHYRQQLSALMDGALAPDEARFLLRRLQHDGELSECWERWQLAGEVMRGRPTAVLPTGFAMRVGEAISEAALASKTQTKSQTRWVRWGGSVALAASVAVVALLATRQAPNAPEQPAATIAVATPAPTIESPAPATSSPAPITAQLPNAGPTVASVAAADAPRRSVRRARSTQGTRVQTRAPMPTSGEAATEVAFAATAAATQTPRPFDASALPSSRPWPRAVLPQFGAASGALTAGTESGNLPSFYPFEPRLPENTTEPDAGPAQPR